MRLEESISEVLERLRRLGVLREEPQPCPSRSRRIFRIF